MLPGWHLKATVPNFLAKAGAKDTTPPFCGSLLTYVFTVILPGVRLKASDKLSKKPIALGWKLAALARKDCPAKDKSSNGSKRVAHVKAFDRDDAARLPR